MEQFPFVRMRYTDSFARELGKLVAPDGVIGFYIDPVVKNKLEGWLK